MEFIYKYYYSSFKNKNDKNRCLEDYVSDNASQLVCLGDLDAMNDYSQIINLLDDTYKNLTEALFFVSLVPVIYDEVERFTDSNKDYPFNARKLTLPSFSVTDYERINYLNPNEKLIDAEASFGKMLWIKI